MRGISDLPTVFALGAGLTLAVSLAGCAHVKPQEMEDRLASLRSELQTEITQGDQQTANQLGQRIDQVNSRVDGLESELAALEQEFNARIERLETAIRFDVPVYFGFDEAEVRQQDMPLLDRFAQVVNEYYPLSLITVEGFADPAGSQEYNLQLGKRRADAVKGYLVDRGGLNATLVRTVSYGESTDRLVSDSDHGPGESGWQNRRVALVIDRTGS